MAAHSYTVRAESVEALSFLFITIREAQGALASSLIKIRHWRTMPRKMKDEDFDGLMASVAEARAFAQGQAVPGLRVHHFPAIDIAAIRKKNRRDARRLCPPNRRLHCHPAQLGTRPPPTRRPSPRAPLNARTRSGDCGTGIGLRA